jgi:hypothetical protein
VSSEYNQEPLNQIPSILKKFTQILLNLKSRRFFEFLFKFHFESKEVYIEKVVPLFNYFKCIFYLKIFNHGKPVFSPNQFKLV